ncbi:MAG: ankyrin repeat domain-containing protein [Rickettsiales bacterium]|nr:ankyrin repeat domain-containing protein [Rickettsiales bacterium]
MLFLSNFFILLSLIFSVLLGYQITSASNTDQNIVIASNEDDSDTDISIYPKIEDLHDLQIDFQDNDSDNEDKKQDNDNTQPSTLEPQDQEIENLDVDNSKVHNNKSTDKETEKSEEKIEDDSESLLDKLEAQEQEIKNLSESKFLEKQYEHFINEDALKAHEADANKEADKEDKTLQDSVTTISQDSATNNSKNDKIVDINEADKEDKTSQDSITTISQDSATNNSKNDKIVDINEADKEDKTSQDSVTTISQDSATNNSKNDKIVDINEADKEDKTSQDSATNNTNDDKIADIKDNNEILTFQDVEASQEITEEKTNSQKRENSDTKISSDEASTKVKISNIENNKVNSDTAVSEIAIDKSTVSDIMKNTNKPKSVLAKIKPKSKPVENPFLVQGAAFFNNAIYQPPNQHISEPTFLEEYYQLLFASIKSSNLNGITAITNKIGPNYNIFINNLSPLTYAIINNNNPYVIREMLSLGYDPNTIDLNNKSPLYYAVEFKKYDFAIELLLWGANPNFSARNEVTPYDLAMHNDDTLMLDILQRAQIN